MQRGGAASRGCLSALSVLPLVEAAPPGAAFLSGEGQCVTPGVTQRAGCHALPRTLFKSSLACSDPISASQRRGLRVRELRGRVRADVRPHGFSPSSLPHTSAPVGPSPHLQQ